jgi:stearoyl-CoA desaturase (delta-9 desaturase)
MMQDGLLNLSIAGMVISALLLTHITIASVTIFLHRHQSHHALSLHPIASHFFRFWLWLTTGMVTRQWVAIHRKHHAKCETEEDPHSPRIKGIKTVLLQGSELYRAESLNQETLDKYGHGTPDDWIENQLYSRFPFLGIVLMAILDILLFGIPGIVIFAVQMLWIPIWAAGVINGIGHYAGYRNFETVDASTNILPWGILVGGEELHNNHHAYAASAKLSNKWWEFDIGWFYIRTLETLGLASVKRTPPELVVNRDKQLVDMETVRAVVSNRYYVLKQYGVNVIKPVSRQAEQQSEKMARQLLQRARKFMIREDLQLVGKAQEIIDSALQLDTRLATVYRFKQQLKEVWDRTSQNQANRVQRLQDWCAEAEQTGIESLQDFAAYLRGYHLQEST